MKINAVIFDLDGTLIDTELLWAQALAEYLGSRECAVAFDTILPLVYGRAWSDIYHSVVSKFPELATITTHTMARELRTFYLRLQQKNSALMIPTSIQLLKQLAQTHPVIIVSGSPRADVESAVKLMEISTLLRFVLGTEDYAPGKPAPAGFLLGAQRLQVQPAECLVFEDSEAGVKAAKAAGMWCVALARPQAHPQDLTLADWVVQDLAEFSFEELKRVVNSSLRAI